MKVIIKEVNDKSHYFTAIVENRLLFFYLPKNLYYNLSKYLVEKRLIDFQVSTTSFKKILRIKAYKVTKINSIIDFKYPKLSFYFKDLQNDMENVLFNSNKYYLFIDFEMTMPDYNQKGSYNPEILQFGGLLTDYKGRIIERKNYYVKTTKRLNKHTIDFLNLNVYHYEKSAKPFIHFYNDLHNIIIKYKPKFITWGNFDYKCLTRNIQNHNLKKITSRNNFIDLSIVHKNYFGYKNTSSLFNTYCFYFQKDPNKVLQKHNAMEDSIVLKEVFFKFKSSVKGDK